jgi:NTE family protein
VTLTANAKTGLANATGATGPRNLGLVLSGGGARGAYQAGVLRAIAEISRENGIAQPFKAITGVSAGAINAAYLACMADSLTDACDNMAALWRSLTADRVYKTDALSAGRSGFRLAMDAAFGALYAKKMARSLLDTSPLRHLLAKTIPFDRLGQMIAEGRLNALGVTAMNYASASSITFVQGRDDLPMWSRSRRWSTRAQIGIEHVMASSAIPLFFPPVRVDDAHYGDGCLRNTAPLSPAIHLGADKLIVISVRRPDQVAAPIDSGIEPTIARILGVILNALLLDAVDLDMERMSRVNQTIDSVPGPMRRELNLRKIDFLWLRPSQDIGHLAASGFAGLPAVLRYLLNGLGSSSEASEVASYLLFDPAFCGQLVEIGYRDGLANREAIQNFLLL